MNETFCKHKEPDDHKDYKPSDKWPPAATCLDPNVFITISKDYLSCCDLWVEPAAVIYCATDQWVSVCWLVMAVTLVQSSDALSANCTMSGSREPSRCSAASGSRTLERARDLFVLFCHKTQLRHYWLFGMSSLWLTENSSSSARGQNIQFTEKQALINLLKLLNETAKTNKIPKPNKTGCDFEKKKKIQWKCIKAVFMSRQKGYVTYL